MALESASFINGLVATNPTSSDNVGEGDNHLRLIKSTLLATFPSITGAVTVSHTQINSTVATVEAATSANTASAVVKRDASGNFSAGTITANLTGDVTGNASTASTWATARTLTLGGDASGSVSINGSGDSTLTVTVADNSHAHTIGNVTGLQDALDAKLGSTANAASATKWQTARSLTLDGDANGTVSIDGTGDATLTVTVADDSHAHVISNVDGLQAALDGKLGSTANAASASKWNTARTLTVDGDGLGSVSIDGSQNVTLTLTVTDDSHNHDGRYYTEAEADAAFLGKTANAASASKWNTARSLTLDGDASGTVSIDGSQNVSLTVTVADDSHNHTIANVDGLQTALNGKLGTTATAANSTKWGNYNVSTDASGTDANTIYFRS
jgi:hypothetical protein